MLDQARGAVRPEDIQILFEELDKLKSLEAETRRNNDEARTKKAKEK